MYPSISTSKINSLTHISSQNFTDFANRPFIDLSLEILTSGTLCATVAEADTERGSWLLPEEDPPVSSSVRDAAPSGFRCITGAEKPGLTVDTEARARGSQHESSNPSSARWGVRARTEGLEPKATVGDAGAW